MSGALNVANLVNITGATNAAAAQSLSFRSQDYNIGIDGAKDFQTYKEIFKQFGDVVINQQQAKKKGLFGKLFS